MRIASFATGASMVLAALAFASLACADAPPDPNLLPLYSRYSSVHAYQNGGAEGQSAFDAERNRIPGAADDAVAIEDLADGTRQVTIRFEIIEVQEEVYPGKFVLFWVYAPVGSAMSSPARMPSPTIRVQEGDHVRIELYNTHYFPHTIHFHGLSVPADMDGTPDFSQPAVEPGKKFVYEFTAKYPGTYWYHCHVDPSIHAMMGLAGMLIVEPKRPDNHFAPVVVGAGRIWPMAKGTAEDFQGEYSLVYQDVDERLNRIALAYTDPREVEMRMHRDYDSSQRKPDIFLLNGRSFPFTLLDSPILVKSNEVTRLRILNAGGQTIAFHTHGHHPVLIALDGDPLPPALQYSRDTFEIAPAQRIDLALHTGDDGRYAAGPGVWMVHDHTPSAEVNGGIDGGDMTAIVYDGFMQANGLPKVAGNLEMMFHPDFYRGKMPMFDPKIYGTDAANYDKGWPAAPLGGAFDYPHRQDSDDGLPNLALIDAHRHQVAATACKDRPRSAQTITIKAGRAYARPGEVFAFEPRIVHVERCAAVTIVLENTDEIRHDFMIPGLDPMVAINFIGPGRQQATFVTPDADVTLIYHCHVSTHERHGMLGYLVVGKGSALAPGQAEGIPAAESLDTLLAENEQGSGPGAAAPNQAALAQPGAAAAAKSFIGTGQVISTIPRSRQLIVNGDEIPGYMAAMVMGYLVVTPSLLEGLNPQDRVQFTIDGASNTITKIEVLQRAP